MPILEVAICTLNRVVQLQRAVDSVLKAKVPEGWNARLIVVNNGSTDATGEYLTSLEPRNWKRSIINESKRGLTICRNRVIESAEGDLLLWTDDDVIVDPDWITGYVDAFLTQPDCSFWGGPILPLLPDDTDEWILENRGTLAGCFAERALGDTPFDLTPEMLPYGANFALRTSVQKRFHFDENRGRVGSELGGGDETDLMKRLLSSQHRGRWVPTAKVQHAISSERLDENWVRAYFEHQGRELVRSGNPWSHNPRWLAIQAAWHHFQYRRLRKRRHSAAWLGHLIRNGLATGQANELAGPAS